MKTQKRDRLERTYTKGYTIGNNGKSLDLCPHEDNIELRQAWVSGWREGRADNWDGFTGVSGVHKKAYLQY